MAELIVTRGLPGSGKTSWAQEWVDDGRDDGKRRARVNRDDLRGMLFGLASPLSHDLEKAVSTAQQEQVRALLEAGWDVVVDDTNLRRRYLRQWAELASDAGASFCVEDFTHVPVDECVARDARRGELGGRLVGEPVIRELAARLANAGRHDVDLDSAGGWLYQPDAQLDPAWIVDLDGTIALHNGRSPYDYSRVGEDLLNEPVALLVHELAENAHIVFVSGRDSVCRPATEEWLWTHFPSGWSELFMRAEGDRRDDATVKLEILRHEIAPRWNVLGAIDDRNRVVRAWRRAGLLCLQVAPGAF